MGMPHEESEVYVNVTFSLGGNFAGTRATIDPVDASDGKPALSMGGDDACDYYIDPWDIDILLFTRGNEADGSDGVFVDRVHVAPFWISQGESDGHRVHYYTLRGSVSLSEEQMNQSYQMMAVCNMGRKADGGLYTTDAEGNIYSTYYESDQKLVKGSTTRDAFISELRYVNYNGEFSSALRNDDTKARIPMWGIREVVITTNNDANNFSMDLLRAMAKVRVSISQDLYNQGYRLTYVGMSRTHLKGYMVAQGDQAVRRDGNIITTNYNSDSSVGISQASIPEEPGSEWCGFVSAEANRSHVFYMPEYANTDASGNPLDAGSQTYMSLQIMKLENEDWENAKPITYGGEAPQLYFADYSAATNPTQSTWDVIRNDFYDYTITNIVEENTFKVNLQVVPWFEYTHSGVVM